SVYNSIFTGYPDAGILLDSRRTVANYCNQDLQFKGNILAGNTGVVKLASNSDTLCVMNISELKNAIDADNDTLVNSNDVQLVDAFNNTLSNRDLRPTNGSIASTGAIWDFVDVFYGIEEGISANLIEVYPNPASDIITIKVENAGKIQVLDMTGRLVYNVGTTIGKESVVDVSKWSAGVYLVRVEVLGEVWTRKIVKR